MRRLHYTLALVTLATTPALCSDAHEVDAARPQKSAPLGMNLARANHWSSSQPFVDAIVVADDWVSGSLSEFRDGREVAVDARGWIRRLEPKQVARMVIIGEAAVRPAGVYTFTYEGRGELRFDGAASIVEREAPGRIKVKVREKGVVLLVVTSVDPDDPIRNAHLYYPGGRCADDVARHCTNDAQCGRHRCVPFEENADAEPFHPTFLEELAPFSVVRFLDWMDGNRELDDPRPFPERLSDWPTREDRRYHPVPFELMATLANKVGADPWLTMPPLASDELLRDALRAFKAALDPSRKVYVELGNELWNDIFRQHHLINAAGCRARAEDASVECDPDGNGILCEPGPWDDTQARCRVYGLAEQATRSARLFEIAREVFGPKRVVRVLAGQFGSFSSRGGPMLETKLKDGSTLSEHVDVYAIAPYFGARINDREELKDAFETTRVTTHEAPPGTYVPVAGKPSMRFGGPYSRLANDVRSVAAYPGIRIAAYEGGPHFVGHTPELAKEVARVNRDRRMKALYLSFLATWDRMTRGALFVHYASSNAWGRHGAWGVKEYQGQPRDEAPKYDALLTHMKRDRGRRGKKAKR
jgi:hypothetical protein